MKVIQCVHDGIIRSEMIEFVTDEEVRNKATKRKAQIWRIKRL